MKNFRPLEDCLVMGLYLKKTPAPQENPQYSTPIDVPNYAGTANFAQVNIFFLELNFKLAI